MGEVPLWARATKPADASQNSLTHRVCTEKKLNPVKKKWTLILVESFMENCVKV